MSKNINKFVASRSWCNKCSSTRTEKTHLFQAHLVSISKWNHEGRKNELNNTIKQKESNEFGTDRSHIFYLLIPNIGNNVPVDAIANTIEVANKMGEGKSIGYLAATTASTSACCGDIDVEGDDVLDGSVVAFSWLSLFGGSTNKVVIPAS